MGHANTRLTPHGRLLLVRRVQDEGRPAAHVAKEMGVSRKCAYKWVARYRAEGIEGLQDRSSRPHTCPARTPVEVEDQVVTAWQELRCGPDGVGQATGVPARTVARILTRRGVPRLAECDPLTGQVIRASRHTIRRYEHDAPGDMVHIDVKKIGKIPDGGGWRAHGRGERPASKRGVGYDYVHAAVDDHSRLAYAEILPDERGTTCAGFLLRAAAWFATQDAITQIGARHKTIRPHCPWQNGKVERFNRTLQVEWAYRQVFTSNTDRADALAPWLKHYNTQRRHTALGGHPPISRLSPT